MKFKRSIDYYKYCPVCGQPFALKKMHGRKVLKCSACGFVFFQNSKPTASAFITNAKGQLLLVKRAIQPKFGWWDIPGGFLEEGEDPVVGVKRELLEELGVTLRQIKLLGLYPDTYDCYYRMHTLTIIYTAKIKSGVIKPMDDVGSFRWFSKNQIPWSKFAFPMWMKPAIRDWLTAVK
jgi:NAD+ diphosphatase